MRIFLIFLFIFTICFSASADDGVEVTVEEIHPLPQKEPEYSLFTGYRFIDVTGSERTVEYEYPDDSIVLGGYISAYPLPHRLYIGLDIKNKKDYFGELRYSYHDIFYLRGISRSLFHNLDNIRLQSGLETPSPPPYVHAINRLDAHDEKYGIRAGINTIFLRLKTPDFPAHFYIDAGLIERKGTQQQRSLLGSGYWNSMVRTSQKRAIDWQKRDVTVGANSHIGFIEIDLSHTERRFDAEGDRIFSHNYNAALPIRSTGEFPHNLIPELKGSTNTIRLHTSYTGRLTASATLTKIDRENTSSGARSDYFIGSAEMQWLPMHELAIFLKYRHKDADIDNPDSIPVNYLGYPSYTSPIPVKPSLSYINDIVIGTLRYRPIKGVTLWAEYNYDNMRRQNSDRWHMPDSSQKHTFTLSTDVRVLKNLSLKARYIHKEVNNPALNIEPDRSDEGRLSVSWIPVPMINALLSYNVAKEKRDKITCAEGCSGEDADNREIKRDRLLGSMTFLLLDNLSLTASYAYLHNRVEQDIVYSKTIITYGTDRSVFYKDTANTYSMHLNYMPQKNINLNAGISHTSAKGNFRPSDPDLSSVAQFSDFKVRETVFMANGDYMLRDGMTLGIKYKYSRFDDASGNPYNEISDGRAHIVFLTISKAWK